MQTSNRIWRLVWSVGLVVALISAFAGSSFSNPQAPGTEVPVVKGGAGSCTADFVVTDSSGKGIYDAKIVIHIRYGFGGHCKLDATVGTNFEGKARMEGLPEQIKKTAAFDVSHGNQSKSLPFDPQADCHPRHEVILGEK